MLNQNNHGDAAVMIIELRIVSHVKITVCSIQILGHVFHTMLCFLKQIDVLINVNQLVIIVLTVSFTFKVKSDWLPLVNSFSVFVPLYIQ